MRNRGIGAGQIIDRSKLHLYLNKLQHCGINLYIQNEQLILLDEEGHPSLFAPIMIATLSTCAQLERDNISIDVETFRLSHDRFLCIDDDVYHIGASIKDLGKKWFVSPRWRYLHQMNWWKGSIESNQYAIFLFFNA